MKVFRSKLKWIRPYVEGRRLLDLGCVCHELDVQEPPWLHGFLVEHAAEVAGVDFVAEGVEEMNRRGFRAICADVETMALGETFEAIVAGDIVEHLSNPGRLFERAAEHLAPGGVLLVTTPNPLNPLRLLRILVKGRASVNDEHTCWFTSNVLAQLAERFGFEPADEAYADDSALWYRLWPRISQRGGRARRIVRRIRTFIRRLLWMPWVGLASLMTRIRPRYGETLCMAFRQAAPAEGDDAS